MDLKGVIVFKELMESVATHPGLKKLETPGRPGFTNMSHIKPELLCEAVKRMDDVNLSATALTPQQLNSLCNSVTSDESNQMKRLNLSYNDNLYYVEPSLLANAVSRLETAELSGCLPKLVPHGMAILDTLGRSGSRTRSLKMDTVNLSTVDADFFERRICCTL